MSEEKGKISKNRHLVTILGASLIFVGAGIFFFTFQPYISSYLDYKLTPKPEKEIEIELTKGDVTSEITKDTEVVLVSNEFGLYIPKIQANAKVIKNIDPYDYDAYRNALIHGVVHAKGTALPSESGNVFLFAHSTVNFYERRQYNVYFYLLGELEKDDPIYVSYEGEIYPYKVLEFKVVKPEEIQYLGTYMEQDTLTLMTCWPVGSNSKRAIITAIRETE